MGIVTLNHIFKDYIPGVHAVCDFNLDIEEGEFIVLVGPSGCGKSTTLRMLAGLEDITSGHITIGDKVVNDLHPKDRDIAMVFQNYALYPHMTVKENLSFGLRMKKISKDEIDKRTIEAAKLLGIQDLMNRTPKELSGGQMQRVALGRAIVKNSKLFLMDEPLSNLDAKLRTQTRAELIKLHRNLNATTVYVTHDQTEAMTMATRIVVMKDGLIQQIATPREIYGNPDNVFVASFIGSPGMNFLMGKVNDTGINIGEEVINIPNDLIEKFRERNLFNEDLLIGIRPENFKINQTSNEEMSIEVVPDLTELTGSEVLIHFDIDGKRVIGKVEDSVLEENGKIKLFYDPSRIYFFDPKNEERIRL